ncbi:MAG TPA: FAD-binding oxidoreductase [Arenicellales bacterium]|nr:FAD-binding oxidoreductase [Arenicellales bacterium]
MISTDIVIVGAGAAGATLAAELAGETGVAVLEAEPQAGYHASGRSAAVFVPSYGHGLLRRLTAMSRDFYDRPDPEYFPAPLLSGRGLLRVVLDGGRDRHAAVTRGVPGIRCLSPAEAAERFPLLNPARIVEASYEADVHDIDTEALIQGCLRKARRRGAEILRASPVVGLARAGQAWIVTTPTETVQCRTLVNAAGAWANRLAGLAGLQAIDLTIRRRSVAVLPLPPALETVSRAPFTVSVPLRWYAKTEQTGLLVSPADEEPVEPHDAFADDMTIAEGLHRFSEDTGFEVTRVRRSWAGLRATAPDEYPLIGFDPAAEGFFWLAGQAGFGIQCAPGLAALAAGLIAGNVADPELAESFSVSRLRRP